MATLIGLGLAFGLACASATGDATPYVDVQKRFTAEELRATGLDTLTPEQLALLNRLLRDDGVEVAASATPARTTEPNSVPASPAAPAPLAPASFIGLDDGPIETRLVGSLSGWDVGTEFALANGQRWKVLKGRMALRAALDSPKVLLVPGLAGRWFLQVDEDLPKARVYRVQ